MYKLLLCWRYLKTRYLALLCIVSVMLGVATLIVVNSVMSGFSTKLRDRLHGLLSDVVVDAMGMEGFANPQEKMDRIRKHPFLSQHIEAMTGTLEVFAMMQYTRPTGDKVTRPVHLVGVDPVERSKIPGFHDFLVDNSKKAVPSFDLSEKDRKMFLDREEFLRDWREKNNEPANPEEPPPPMPVKPLEVKVPHGAFVGNLIASFRHRKEDNTVEDVPVLRRGDDIVLVTVSGAKMTPVYDRFVVVDYFKSDMSEYDNNYIFVPLDYLQHLRTMPDRVTSIQIKVKDYAYSRQIVEELQRMFGAEGLRVATWEEKQGPLLQAIGIEKGILNVLLFMIVAVAGFGILAIFSMIVAEKTRDIGILKSLGASNGGVLKIFLGYGLLLGLVGAGLGTGLGLVLTTYINEVEQFLSRLTGQEVFPRDIYYFTEIPIDTRPLMLLLVNFGAVAMAVIFSILPAVKAAMLHPVRALRYE